MKEDRLNALILLFVRRDIELDYEESLPYIPQTTRTE